MDSIAHTTQPPRMLMAWTALLKAELSAVSKSWVLRGWIIVLALVEFFTIITSIQMSRGNPVPASALLSVVVGSFLMLWSTVIIFLSAGSVSLETDVISDSILCRACTRTQYIASKLASRIIVILGVYFVFSYIAGYVLMKYAANDMTWMTMSTGIGIVGLSILLLVTLGISFSVIFNNTLISVISLFALWYVAAPIFNFMGAEYLSPASFTRNLPIMLKDNNAPKIVQITASPTSVTVVFSKELEARNAEIVSNYAVESPEGTKLTPETATYDKPRTSVVLAGLTLVAGDTVKVTAQNVTDNGGTLLSPAGDTADATVPGVKKAETVKPVLQKGEGTVDANTPTSTNAVDVKKVETTVVKKRTSKQPGSVRVISCEATETSLRVLFSNEIDSKDAEKVENYVVESPYGKTQTARTATYSTSNHTVLLSGFNFASGDPVKVTVKDVKDADGAPLSKRGNSAIYTEVTTWKYVLGFGIPTLLAGLFAIVAFTKRDL